MSTKCSTIKKNIYIIYIQHIDGDLVFFVMFFLTKSHEFKTWGLHDTYLFFFFLLYFSL